MNDGSEAEAPPGNPDFPGQVRAKAARMVRSRRNPKPGVWFGLGMMGLVGWSVVVPTLLGAALGLWLDKHHPGRHAWTLALLVSGLVLGCYNAWHWVAKEERAMRKETADERE
ncbi:MAG: AtpZ/AtpI family protein [Fibrobacteria bacterium]